MAYIGKSPSSGVRDRYYYTATGGETSVSGLDDNNRTLVFTDGKYVDVQLNGITLVAGVDYVTSTANTISGLDALTADDILEVVVYDVFSIADTVSSARGGSFDGGVTFNGPITFNDSLNISTLTGTSLIYDSASFTRISSDLIPAADSTYDLGTSSLKWKDLYLSGSTIFLGDVRLKDEGGSLAVQTSGGGAIDLSARSLNADSATITGPLNVGADSINETKIGQWDTAFGWGDHSVAGYADSASVQGQIDAIDTELVSDTTPQLGGTLDANGNDIDMGTNTITDTKVGQWDEAYSWGDHALAGYADSASVQSQIDGISVTPTQVSDQNNTSTGFFDLPAGTSAQRPGSPANGYARYNTDTHVLEVYADGGWVASGFLYTPAAATGGTTSDVGGYRYHTFTSSGTLTATQSGSVDILTVAGGGGGGGNDGGGGGGGGGYSSVESQIINSGTSYSVTVGAGGAGGNDKGSDGGASSFGSITSVTGGGGGGKGNSGANAGRPGGSGGGGGWGGNSGGSGTSGQGFPGGQGNGSPGGSQSGGGGGGASEAGTGTAGTSSIGDGGDGLTWLNGTTYAGGGSAGTDTARSTAGTGGGGTGGRGSPRIVATAGTANRGGGGGGGEGYGGNDGANGGSGVVIVRYPI